MIYLYTILLYLLYNALCYKVNNYVKKKRKISKFTKKVINIDIIFK